MITDTDGDISFWTINYDDLRRVTYNGKDYFVGENKSIEVNSGVILVVNRDADGNFVDYSKSNNVTGTPGDFVWTQTKDVVGVQEEPAKTATADVEIVDGWKLGAISTLQRTRAMRLR